ncbi:MAG: hypothetical protein QOJ72_2895 [Nocardioidaceae bacterium]|nr:hypothetical protein [Nocardioidaceae bacterium]
MSVLADARAAHQELARAQKSGAGVPWYMRVVNRRLGRLIAALSAQLPISPNQLTGASFASFLAAAGLLVWVHPGVVMAVGAVLLLQLGFAFDSADGQLARLQGGGSPAGEWLDHVVDSARHLMFHLAVLVGLFRFTDVSDAVLLVPIGFGVVATVRFFAQILAEQLARRDPVAGPDAVPRFGTLIQLPADTGVLNFAVLLWPWTTAFLWVYGIIGALNLLLLLATVVRRHRELDALRPGGSA